ncbi:hypothetical protein PR003_g8558 [Phytophthora rubi]|uniref:DDE-1 domain-containing protein n=1 Tax=Phytophthora rubi TaxID=129364 RepID=A0A6A4FX85_9STRA|nr:hypothetical protein PR001_g10255 [Phytophthora rubi]KAE9344280.1 hypothetical protein PR003_g8558 [Phytophthora rubi]
MADDAARSLQQVVPLCDRVRCTDWMELDQALRGSNGLYGRTADFFPALFRSSDRRKKQVSLEKQIQIDKDVTKHMGELKRQFEDGTLIPDEQYNMDESHFVIDLDDGNTLDFVGAQSVKYWSIVSGREGITTCVLLKGGSDARILCPMLIFKNKASSYPMQNLPDKISGVCYRTSSSAFINGRLMCEWLRESRCWGPGGPFASSRVLWMDNASGHCGNGAEDTGRELRTKVKLFPANATDKVQPADRFPIQRIKENWCRLAERRNMEAIRNGDWKTGASSSGKLANPGKMFFLKLAAECIRLVNLEKDKDGDNWTKKAMVQCGFDVPRDDWAA